MFEDRLIRHIEQRLGVRAHSLDGMNTAYWRFMLPGETEPVELAVVGTGYNTVETLKPGERWLLRVREASPGRMTAWLRSHGDDPGQRRVMPKEILQTQFASSRIGDESMLFVKRIPFPVPEDLADH